MIAGDQQQQLHSPDDVHDGEALDPAELIDSAIPMRVQNSYRHSDDGAAPALLGAAAVGLGGFQIALRNPRVVRRSAASGTTEKEGDPAGRLD